MTLTLALREQVAVASVVSLVLSALSSTAEATPASAASVRVAPPPGAAGFGASLAGLGDLDNDGVPDVLVGAPGSGHAYVVSGATGATLHDVAHPDGASSTFGFAVAGIGDLDRDGVGDFAVSAPGISDSAAGTVFVFSGATGTLLRRLAPVAVSHRAFGHSVAGGSDLSGDGVPDVVVAAAGLEQDSGALFAFSGVDGAELWSRPDPLASPGQRPSFGQSVALSPDLSGDGIPDVLVTAPPVSSAPAPTSGGGDLVTNVLVGLVGLVAKVTSAPQPGRVHVVSGADGAVVRTISDQAPGTADAFGAALAPLGDQDGDGLADLLVAEPGTKHLHLYSGSDGRLIRSITMPSNGATVGPISLAPAGDRDGDGRTDVWVGVPAARSVYLVNGTGATLTSLSSPSATGSFGASVAAVGDPAAGSGANLAVGDPTEPGGGAVYLVESVSAATEDLPGEAVALAAACNRTPCAGAVSLQAQTPTSTTTVPTTTTTTGTEAVGTTATLPKPASTATLERTVTADAPLAGTGSAGRPWSGLLALALGLAGIATLRRHPPCPAAGETPSPR